VTRFAGMQLLNWNAPLLNIAHRFGKMTAFLFVCNF